MSDMSLSKTSQKQKPQVVAGSAVKQPAEVSVPAAEILALQHAAGNQAVTHLLHQKQYPSPTTHSGNTFSGHSRPLPVRNVLMNTPGQPLDTETRAFMEARFEHDFSRVRIHADEGAATSARAANATAYTMGQDIVFDSGQYTPETDTGKRLLAHELAHVVQQSRSGTITPPPLPTHPLEQAAQHAASTVVQGGIVHVTGASAPGIARQPRSLSQTLDPTRMSTQELEQEIALIRQWLSNNPSSSVEYDQLTIALSAAEAKLAQKNGQPKPDFATQGQKQIDTSVSGIPVAVAGMLTPSIAPIAPKLPPPGTFPGRPPLTAPSPGTPGPSGPGETIFEDVGEGVAKVGKPGLLRTLGPALARIGVFLTIMLYSPSLNSGEGEMIRRERERERAANQASSQTLPKDPLQLPGQQGQNPAPAVDPTSGEVLYTPAGQDYTPAVDPVTGVPLQAPANRSYGPIEASKRKGTWDPDEGEWRPPGKEHHTRGGLGRSSQKPGGQNIKELEDAVTNSNRLKLTKKGRIALSDLLHGNKRAGDLGSEEDPYKAGDRTFGELEKLGEEFEELYPRGEYPEYYR